MLKKLCLVMTFFSLNVFANEKAFENQLLGIEDIDQEEILDPLSNEDQKYVDALKKEEAEDPILRNEDFPDIDFTEVDALRGKREKAYRQIIKSVSSRNLNFAEKEAMKVQLKDIVNSGTFIGSIRRGTHLVHVKTGKTYYAQKDLTVRAFRLKDYEGYQLLLNNNGYVSYKAPATEVVNIKEMVKLHEPPLHYQPVVEKLKYEIDDKELNYESHFMLNMGLTRPVFLRDLINEENHYGQTLRYEWSNYGRWEFPLKLGFTTQWENSFGSYTGGKYSMQSLSVGPTFKSDPFVLLSNEYSFIVQTRLAVFSRVAINVPGQTINYRTSQTNLVLGLVREINTPLGNILLGANYQRQWIKGSADQFKLDITSTNNYNDSFAVTIGTGADWIW